MNRGVFESPLVQIMGANPSWWNMSNMRNSQDASSPLAFSQQHHELSNSIPMNSWSEDHELPQTWSQLLMGEERYSLGGPFQTKKMENLENYLIYNSQGGQIEDLKQENSSFSRNMLNFSSKKTERKYQLIDQLSESNRTGNRGALKKARIQGLSLSQPCTLKVRKEKLGDRITALHQLVSPFGKTDTASVLFEAFGYIRFLQSQIEALSSPYLTRGSGNLMRQHDGDDEQRKDLRSRGLCLVPVLCTMHVESNINGADYWASSIGGDY